MRIVDNNVRHTTHTIRSSVAGNRTVRSSVRIVGLRLDDKGVLSQYKKGSLAILPGLVHITRRNANDPFMTGGCIRLVHGFNEQALPLDLRCERASHEF